MAGEGEVFPGDIAAVADFDCTVKGRAGFDCFWRISGVEDFVTINRWLDGNGDGDVICGIDLAVDGGSDLEVDGFGGGAGGEVEVEGGELTGVDLSFIHCCKNRVVGEIDGVFKFEESVFVPAFGADVFESDLEGAAFLGQKFDIVKCATIGKIVLSDEFRFFFKGVGGESADERDFFVKIFARASCGHDVAMAEDIGHFFTAEIGSAVGSEAVDFAFLINELAEVGEGLFRNGFALVITEDGDADTAVIARAGVGGNDAFAASATFVDFALSVNDVIVTDVAPTAAGCVIGVDIADSLGGIIEVFGGGGVVDDDFFDGFGVLQWPNEAAGSVTVDDMGILEFVFVFFVEVGVAFDEDLFGFWCKVAQVFVCSPLTTSDDLGLEIGGSGGFRRRLRVGGDGFDESVFDVFDDWAFASVGIEVEAVLESFGRIGGSSGVVFFGVEEVLLFFELEPLTPLVVFAETDEGFDAGIFGGNLAPRKANGSEVEIGF